MLFSFTPLVFGVLDSNSFNYYYYYFVCVGKENAAFIVKASIQGGWVTSALKTLNSWILVLKERESVSYFMPGETGTDYL